jgi:hypothetical protein
MIFWIHFAATWAMIGAVWFVLIVHYPAFLFISKDKFTEFEKFHIQRTLFLVVPVMIIEAVTALILAFHGGLLLLNAFLLAIIWIMTFVHCLPGHACLLKGFSPHTFHRLMALHRARVGLWTLRGILLFFVVNICV